MRNRGPSWEAVLRATSIHSATVRWSTSVANQASCQLGFAKLLGAALEVLESQVFIDIEQFFHVHRTVVVPFYFGTKGGDMKRQREVSKNNPVSIIH